MIAENLQRIRAEIAAAARRAKRNPEEITLVAVSKLFPVELIREAVDAGQTVFGENYIQEAAAKKPQLPEGVHLHFIGHLQSNKARLATETCDMIETVDSLKLATALNNHLMKSGRRMKVLLQVNIGRELQKSGVDPAEAEQLLRQMQSLQQLQMCGLMTIPPLSTEAEASRPHFRELRLLANSLAARGLFPEMERPQLSMGMSDDFPIAIEEGATTVRVGTAIFGRRQ